MSNGDPVVRVAARGDGITQSGKHVARGAPGDVLMADATLVPGPNRQEPPCRHFGHCGGCQLQHIADPALADFVHNRVAFAAEKAGFDPAVVKPAYLSPPHSRRRVSLRFWRRGKGVVLGYSEAGSNQVTDVTQCPVMAPELEGIVPLLRELIGSNPKARSGNVELTVVDQGIDCTISGFPIEGYDATEDALDFARQNGLARLAIDQGYGSEPLWEPEPVTVTLGDVPVAFPSGAFLQATKDGENVLVDAARGWLEGRTRIGDLFCGLGTFAFALSKGRQCEAYEAAREPILACRTAAQRGRLPVTAHHRDLFRNPVRAEDLSEWDGVLIDPPRAGARMQIEQIAASTLDRVVYISCNPVSWAKDAEILKAAGFDLAEARPVGQFRWSTHVELASLFTR